MVDYEFTTSTFSSDISSGTLTTNKNCTLTVSGGKLIVTSNQNLSTPGVRIASLQTLYRGHTYVMHVTGRNISSPNNPFVWIGPFGNNLSQRDCVLTSTESTITSVIIPTKDYSNVLVAVLLSEATVGCKMEISNITFYSHGIEETPHITTTKVIESSDHSGISIPETLTTRSIISSDIIVANDIQVHNLRGPVTSDVVLEISNTDTVTVYNDAIFSSDLTVFGIITSSDIIVSNDIQVRNLRGPVTSDIVLEISNTDTVTIYQDINAFGSITSSDIIISNDIQVHNLRGPVTSDIVLEISNTDTVTVYNNAVFSSDLTVNHNISSTGTIIASSYRTGQVINMEFLQGSDISQYVGSVGSASYTTVATYNYSPLYANSKIITEYHARYTVGGSSGAGLDAFNSRINMAGTQVALRYQQWPQDPDGGGGTRSGTIFPIMGAIDNLHASDITILVQIQRASGDDSVTFYGDGIYDTCMKITEISL